MFNNITQPFSKPSFICSTILTDNPNIRPNSQTLYDLELRNRFSICRKNLLIFLRNTSGKNEIKVNFKIIEKYYKLPFESFPETTEISQILEKIIQRYFVFLFFLKTITCFLGSPLTNRNRRIGIRKISCC